MEEILLILQACDIQLKGPMLLAIFNWTERFKYTYFFKKLPSYIQCNTDLLHFKVRVEIKLPCQGNVCGK
jgi:hypothetical protein